MEYGQDMAIQPLPSFCTWDQRMPYPRPWPGRRTRNAAVVAAVPVRLAAYSVVFAMHQSRYCDTGGLVDVPSFAFGDTAHPSDVTEAKDINEIAKLSTLIYQENHSVEQASTDNGHPYVTVVVATMLSTVNKQPYRDLAVGVNELRGAYLAQKNWNHIDTSERTRRFFVRLALANLGGDSSYAKQVANQIKQLAQHDPTVVAVTGMGQTRDTTLSAADILGSGNEILMVISSPTGNKFVGQTET